LLASCDGRRTIRQITAGWEQAHGPEVQGKGSEIIRALEDHGLVYVTDVRMEL
jgi:hypothetical protein